MTPSPNSTPSLVDTHVHLDEPAFDADRAEVLGRARAAGVTRLINVGYRPARWATTARLAAEEPGIFAMFGLHPGHVDEFDAETLVGLETCLRGRGAVAVGEIGLDYSRDGHSSAAQVAAFAAQLDLAYRVGLPAVIHQRAAEADCAAVLRDAPAGLRVVLHSFDGTAELAGLAVERGWAFGVGGLMTRPRAEAVRRILAELPDDLLLLETDAPYLTPAGVKTRRNEPSNVPVVAARLADLRGIDIEAIARLTTRNAARFFPALAGAERTDGVP